VEFVVRMVTYHLIAYNSLYSEFDDFAAIRGGSAKDRSKRWKMKLKDMKESHLRKA
jgi:hypothetical protein